MTKRIFALLALLVFSTGLRADITLPTAAPPPPPQADPMTIRTLRGDRIIVPLRGHHGGSGAVRFSIVAPPAHGTLSELRLLGDNRATIVYENDGVAPAVNDRFTYLVRTSSDRASSAAEVKIIVEEIPPHLHVPERIEFDQITAGESQQRDLKITNDGGGTLEGRLTVSSPWRLTTSQYRVASGRSVEIPVVFYPGEGREFIGKITLNGADGAESSVVLEGSATLPISLDPAELRIPLPEKEGSPRTGSVSLTNRTDHHLRLKFSAGRSIAQIADVTLAPAEEQTISVALAGDGIGPVHETIVIRGEGFAAHLPVEAEAFPPTAIPPAPPPVAGLPSATPLSRAAPDLPPHAPVNIPKADRAAPPAAASPNSRLVSVRLERLPDAQWELRWARPKETVAQYGIEERFLALDRAGDLQTTWRAVSSPQIAIAGDSVTARLSGLDPRQIHSLKVTALESNGAILWESPLVVLGPPGEPPHRTRTIALILGGALVVLLVLRWRAKRPAP